VVSESTPEDVSSPESAFARHTHSNQGAFAQQEQHFHRNVYSAFETDLPGSKPENKPSTRRVEAKPHVPKAPPTVSKSQATPPKNPGWTQVNHPRSVGSKSTPPEPRKSQPRSRRRFEQQRSVVSASGSKSPPALRPVGSKSSGPKPTRSDSVRPELLPRKVRSGSSSFRSTHPSPDSSSPPSRSQDSKPLSQPARPGPWGPKPVAPEVRQSPSAVPRTVPGGTAKPLRDSSEDLWSVPVKPWSKAHKPTVPPVSPGPGVWGPELSSKASAVPHMEFEPSPSLPSARHPRPESKPSLRLPSPEHSRPDVPLRPDAPLSPDAPLVQSPASSSGVRLNSKLRAGASDFRPAGFDSGDQPSQVRRFTHPCGDLDSKVSIIREMTLLRQNCQFFGKFFQEGFSWKKCFSLILLDSHFLHE